MSEEHRESGRQIATTAQTAWSAPTDPVEKLLDELRRHPQLTRLRLTSNFLNGVGYVLERDGFGAAQAYLMDKAGRGGDRDVAPQAEFVLRYVLPMLRVCPPVIARRSIGRYIIKVLPVLKERRRVP